MNYVTSESIVNEVVNELAMYFNTGKVDTSTFPSVIRSCLARMGNVVLPVAEVILEICGHKARLPEGLHSITVAQCCLNGSMRLPRTNTINTEERYERCEVDLCSRSCNVCRDECNNAYRIIQTFDTYTVEWNDVSYMSASRISLPKCDRDCFHFGQRSPHEFEIRDNHLHVNFEKGLVYLRYRENLENDEGFSIPDFPEITDWIKQALIVQAFTSLWRNGEEVQQKLSFEKGSLRTLEIMALQFYRTSGVHKYVGTAQVFVDRFKAMDRTLYGNQTGYICRQHP